MDKKCTIFYSWQSDIKESRNFISDCLKKLRKNIKEFMICDIDRDTQGLVGAPDIGDSIYGKIDNSDVFIADVTIINSDYSGRKTPNPNVMIELGYAIKTLGWDRIILLYDRDFGDIEELPFDINHKRITSFNLEDKDKMRDYVIACIQKTIHILDEEHRLYGGSAETGKARKLLGQIIRKGIRSSWEAYIESKKRDSDKLYDNIPPISETQMALVEKVQTLLTEEQYELVNKIMFYLKMSKIGTDDMSGWEFTNKLIAECIELLYIEFIEDIIELPIEYILKENVVDLINILSFENHINYEEKRFINDEIIFSTSKDELFACDANKKIICRGKIEEGGFTGYKHTYDYDGYYVNDKRDGKGKEYCYSFYDDNSYFLLRDGIWANDEFVEGRINGVLAEMKNGEIEYIKNADDNVITKKEARFNLSIMEKNKYFYVDLMLENGRYSIIDGSIRKV
ncbi:MAG: hypothetical protein IJV15_03105 [Lachnospiraceae bacterium]|nr:hypothetical protein [Lachnospiraceae bacterium]